MRGILLISLALLLSACGGGPTVPDWKRDSVSLIQKYKRAELKGENRLAERYFEQALDAAGSAGRLEETAQLHLVRCATRQASLGFEPCSGYLALAKFGARAEDEAYYRFISGQWDKLDAGKLPVQYPARSDLCGGRGATGVPTDCRNSLTALPRDSSLIASDGIRR